MLKDNIIFIVPSMKSGGLERVASVFLNTIVQLGYQNVVIINLSSAAPFYKLDDKIIYHSISDKINNKNKLLRAISTRNWLRKTVKNYDSPKILSFGEGYNAFVIFSLLGLKIDLFVTNRASPLSSLKGFRGLINPFFYKFTKGVIVQTNLAKEILKPKYKKVNFHVLANPIDMPSNLNDFQKKENIILNVGRIGGNKNQQYLINYLQNIHFENHDWHLNFIGDGPNRAQLESLISNSAVNEKVSVLGTKNQMQQHYELSKIFAFTSTSEGFPNVLLEAMSYGLPCISFDCIAGPADLIEDGVDGFLIPMGNHKLYEKKLLALITDEELRITMSKNALKKAAKYDSFAVTKQLVNIISGNANSN